MKAKTQSQSEVPVPLFQSFPELRLAPASAAVKDNAAPRMQ
jgi:hypothetical protein